jgi:hypothetical protein
MLSTTGCDCTPRVDRQQRPTLSPVALAFEYADAAMDQSVFVSLLASLVTHLAMPVNQFNMLKPSAVERSASLKYCKSGLPTELPAMETKLHMIRHVSGVIACRNPSRLLQSLLHLRLMPVSGRPQISVTIEVCGQLGDG